MRRSAQSFLRRQDLNIPRELSEAARFHTHLGPYLVVGLRMGGVVTRQLGDKPFTYKILANTGKVPPYSCVVDGVQISTPCTVGNSGLAVGEERLMTIEAKGASKALSIALRPEIFDWIENECREEDCETFACEIWNMEEERLLSVHETSEGEDGA
jgi:formylmethanofuran dehydrogenase subunit E